jgi:hypothetical protein
MKTINLEEILDQYLDINVFGNIFPETLSEILVAMKDACDKTVDLCVENVEVNTISARVWVEKESILKTKDQIK